MLSIDCYIHYNSIQTLLPRSNSAPINDRLKLFPAFSLELRLLAACASGASSSDDFLSGGHQGIKPRQLYRL